MIYPSLAIITDRLNAYIYEKWGATTNGTSEIVQLNNIANAGEEKNDLQNKIVITLIKIEEETSLKNSAFYQKKGRQEITKHHPAIHLNLFLLFSVTKKDYREALQLLSDTITFFQVHNVFSVGLPDSGPDEAPAFKITVELHDIHFQEVFDMWSNLGNKQFPSVVYKVRLLKFLDMSEAKTVPAVQVIHVDHKQN